MSATLAEHLDSTPELRARRDRMLAMCDLYDRLTAKPVGWLHLYERRNIFTDEWIKLTPPVEVHADDLEWLEDLWQESDRIDYILWRAGCSTG